MIDLDKLMADLRHPREEGDATMINPALDVDDVSAWYFSTREGMTKRDLSEPAQRILEVLLSLSFLEQRKEAPIDRLEELAAAAMKMHRGNLRRFLDELIKGEVIMERHDGAFYWFEINPDWSTWRIPRRFKLSDERESEQAIARLKALCPAQLELIEREPDLTSEVGRAFAAAAGSNRTAAVVRCTTNDPDPGDVVRCTTGPPGRENTRDRGEVVRRTTNSSCTGTGTEQAKACQLPVQEVTGHRPAIAGLGEQMDRLEDAIGPVRLRPYVGWWRLHFGKSPERVTALRQSLDDLATNRKTVRDPVRWLVKTAKNKVRALGETLHLL